MGFSVKKLKNLEVGESEKTVLNSEDLFKAAMTLRDINNHLRKKVTMSLLSENVIPGNHGKIFGTNAKTHQELVKIKESISHIEGIKDIIIEEDKFPREFTIHTSAIVSVKEIEDAAIQAGFHVIPKSLFGL